MARGELRNLLLGQRDLCAFLRLQKRGRGSKEAIYKDLPRGVRTAVSDGPNERLEMVAPVASQGHVVCAQYGSGSDVDDGE